jgi:hypothetical protein
MPLAIVANWLFNWALGLFVPPALRNITYKIFITFGVLCFAAAVQAFLTYPETCGKTLEEVELPFARGAPAAWKTKPGGSRIEAAIEAVIAREMVRDNIHENMPLDGRHGIEAEEQRGDVSHVEA